MKIKPPAGRCRGCTTLVTLLFALGFASSGAGQSAAGAMGPGRLTFGPSPIPRVLAGLHFAGAQTPATAASTGGKSAQSRGPIPGATTPGKNAGQGAPSASPHHIFFVIPAYKVDYSGKFVPMTAHEKLTEYLQGAYDPMGLAGLAVETGFEHSPIDGFCGYGLGVGGFGKCYGSALLDANVSSFFGDYLFNVWLHEDPRYFRLGPQAGIGTRIWYAVTRTFISRSDSGGWTFAAAPTSGTVLAAVASNLYYPQSERNMAHTMSRIEWDLGGTVIFNLEAEFWPDIQYRLGKIF